MIFEIGRNSRSCNKVAIFVLCVFALIWTNLAVARVTASACNNCNEDQYEATAAALANNSGSTAAQYIYDLANGNLRKFQIAGEPVYGGYTYYANAVAPETAVVQAFQVYEKALADNGGNPTVFATRNQSESGAPDSTVSTMSVVQTGAYQYDYGVWVTSGNVSPFVTDSSLTVSGLASAISSIALKQNPLVLNVQLNMKDGGILTFVFDGSQKYAKLVEARDANHNLIPFNIAQVTNGNYIFRDGSGGTFTDWLKNLGVDFSSISTCVNGTLACVTTGGGAKSCTWSPCSGVR